MCDKINEEIKILKEENFKKAEIFIKALTNEDEENQTISERLIAAEQERGIEVD